MKIIAITLTLLLSGCATGKTVVVDSFCLSPASKKRTWSVDKDRPEAIREARVWNTYVDRRCGIPGQRA
jgi:hypothetical protein